MLSSLRAMTCSSSVAKSRNCLAEVTRRGAVVLFTDFIVRTLSSIMCLNINSQFTFVLIKLICFQIERGSDVERLTWIIINHVNDVIALSSEPPIQDFVG